MISSILSPASIPYGVCIFTLLCSCSNPEPLEPFFDEGISRNRTAIEAVSSFNENTEIFKAGRPIGYLEINYTDGTRNSCTAIVASNRTILTNYHCLPGRGKEPSSARLFMEYTNRLEEIRPIDVGVVPIASDPSLDYSFVRSYSDLSEFLPVRFSFRDPQIGENFRIYHHPGGGSQKVTQRGCSNFGSPLGMIGRVRHSCDTVAGSSGGAVYGSADGYATIVALHTGGELLFEEASPRNYAALMSAIDQDVWQGGLTWAAVAVPAESASLPASDESQNRRERRDRPDSNGRNSTNSSTNSGSLGFD